MDQVIEKRKFGMSDKHKQLQDMAIGWLYGVGCSVFAKEVPTRNGNADALGIRTRGGKEAVYYIEAKASRSDLICFKQKACYLRSIGGDEAMCYYHSFKIFPGLDGKNHAAEGAEFCEDCKRMKAARGDTGIDFYYFIVADGIKIEDTLYPLWGVINESGKVIRKAKRMRREGDTKSLVINIAHVLVYKVFGKMYGI